MRSARKTRNRIIALAILVIFVATIAYTNNPSAMFYGTGFALFDPSLCPDTSTTALDDDNDGIIDTLENGPPSGTNPSGTNPCDPDTDDDGVNEGAPLNPLADAFPIDAGASIDSDGDGMPDELHTGWTGYDTTTSTPSSYNFQYKETTLTIDLDDDNDGIADIYENSIFPTQIDLNSNSYPTSESDVHSSDQDYDSDTDPNRIDIDSDADCILDTMEMFRIITNSDIDVDDDGNPNFLDEDSDGDGISDLIEAGTVPLTVNNFKTYWQSIMDLIDPDTNFKIFKNGNQANDNPFEFTEGTCPLDPADSDSDKIPNYLDDDSDGDGIADDVEAQVDTNGNPVDSDSDGKPDYIDTDSDEDGIADYVEGVTDSDGDGIPNYLDIDSDGDYLKDKIEILPTNNYKWDLQDTDGDGLLDGYEYTYGDCGANQGSDDDADSDGLTNAQEQNLWTNCKSEDTDGDGRDDDVEVSAGTDPLTACSPGPIAVISDPYMLDDETVTLSSRGSMPKGYKIVFDASLSTNYASDMADGLIWEQLNGVALLTTDDTPTTVTYTSSTDEKVTMKFAEAKDYEVKLTLNPAGVKMEKPNAALDNLFKDNPGTSVTPNSGTKLCSVEETLTITIDEAEDFSPVKSINVSIELSDEADQTLLETAGIQVYPKGKIITLTGTVEGSQFATQLKSIKFSIYNTSKNYYDENKASIGKTPVDGELIDEQTWETNAPTVEGTYTLKYEVIMMVDTVEYTESAEMQIEINNGLNPILSSPKDGDTITLNERIIFKDDSISLADEEISTWTIDIGDRATPWGYLKIPENKFVCFSATSGDYCDEGVKYQSTEIDSPCGCEDKSDGEIYPLAKMDITDFPDQTLFHTYKTVDDCGEDYICQVILSIESENYKSEKSIELNFEKSDICAANPEEDICKSAVGVDDLCVKWPSLAQCVTGGNITGNNTGNESYKDPFEASRGKENQVYNNPPNNDGNIDPLGDLGGDDDKEDTGGSIPTILIVIMLLSAIGGLGFYFWKKGMFDGSKSKPSSTDSFEATPETVKSEPAPVEKEEPNSGSEIQSYIDKAKVAGETDEQMKEGLKAAGWPDSEINKYL